MKQIFFYDLMFSDAILPLTVPCFNTLHVAVVTMDNWEHTTECKL